MQDDFRFPRKYGMRIALVRNLTRYTLNGHNPPTDDATVRSLTRLHEALNELCQVIRDTPHDAEAVYLTPAQYDLARKCMGVWAELQVMTSYQDDITSFATTTERG